MYKFAIIGAAGYVAKRHMQAISETQNTLQAAYDPYDGIGIIDQYFPQTDFFTEFERFDRYINKQTLTNQAIDFLTVCSPNYLHDAHIRFGLNNQMNVICEKPLVLNPWNAERLLKAQEKSNKAVFPILQLRLHPSIIAFKQKVDENPNQFFDIDLNYITSRGKWYYASWKGDITKSGGIASNIGIHFFDALIWIFGDIEKNEVHIHEHDRAAGCIYFKNAKVRWFLSIDGNTLPDNIRKNGKTYYRMMLVNGKELHFSDGFENLHTKSYQNILNGNGFSILDAMPAIEIVHQIRNANLLGKKGNYHPFVDKPFTKHPFKS